MREITTKSSSLAGGEAVSREKVHSLQSRYNITASESETETDYISWYPSLLEWDCLHLTRVARLYTKAELPMMQPHSITAIPLSVEEERSMAYLEDMIKVMINCDAR